MSVICLAARGYFRGIRPGLIEAWPILSRLMYTGRYFRGIRPGLIEATPARRSGAFSPLGISGASAPASLKLSGQWPQPGEAGRYFRGIRPGLIEAYRNAR